MCNAIIKSVFLMMLHYICHAEGLNNLCMCSACFVQSVLAILPCESDFCVLFYISTAICIAHLVTEVLWMKLFIVVKSLNSCASGTAVKGVSGEDSCWGCGLKEFWGEQQQGLSRTRDTAAGNDLISLLLEAFFSSPDSEGSKYSSLLSNSSC